MTKTTHKKSKTKKRKGGKKQRRVTGKYNGGTGAATDNKKLDKINTNRLKKYPKIRAAAEEEREQQAQRQDIIEPPASQKVFEFPELKGLITQFVNLNNTIENPISKSLRKTKLEQVTGIKPKSGSIDNILDKDLTILTNPAFVNITMIDLQGCVQVTDTGVQTIANSCPNLTTIYLYDTQLSDVGLKALAESVCGNKLTTLILGGEIVALRITDIGMRYIASSCPNLKTICISDTGVRDQGLMALAPLMTQQGIVGCPNLTHINLNDTLVMDIGVTTFATRLGAGLESIYLANTQISDPSVQAIGNNCPNLKKIWLATRPITDVGVQALARGCPLLEDLDLGVCQSVTDTGLLELVPTDHHRGCPNLTKIKLAATQITDTGMTALANACRNLTELELFFTTIGDESLTAFGNNCHNLKKINLRSTRITDAGISALIPRPGQQGQPSHPGCPNLTVIFLDETEVTNDGVYGLVEGCQNLTTIQVFRTNVTDAGKQWIRGIRDNINIF